MTNSHDIALKHMQFHEWFLTKQLMDYKNQTLKSISGNKVYMIDINGSGTPYYASAQDLYEMFEKENLQNELDTKNKITH